MFSKKIKIASIIILLISNAIIVYHYYSTANNNHTESYRLYLTPLIEEGRLDEARKLAAVNHEELFSVESYSGYLTVNKQYNSNLFFWYFPSETDPKNAPVVLWLQGGPGTTSLWALFFENGPFKMHNNRTLTKRQYSFSSNHNVIYIDSPIGAGYSFTDDDRGTIREESKIYDDLYVGLLQFYKLFPELQKNHLFIGGECYAGKFIPAISHLIHQKNPTAELKINLKGLSIGNGWLDSINQLNFGDHLHQIGLLDQNSRDQFRVYEEKIRSFLRQNDLINAAKVFNELLFDSLSVLARFTGFKKYIFNYLQHENQDDWEAAVDWLTRPDVRAAIHVGNDTSFAIMNYTIWDNLQHELLLTQVNKTVELLSHYKVMLYVGQLDIFIPYSSIESVVLNLEWDGLDSFKKTERSTWWSGDDMAGYVSKAGNLSVVLIRNAGHTAGIDQPKWVFEMFTKFTHS